MSKTIAADRRRQITDTLGETGSIKIPDLAQRFGVSKETIRRDLIFLEEKGLLQKSHGGAITTDNYEFDTIAVEKRIGKNYETKMLICKKALSLLSEQAVVFVDTGSTMHCMAELLCVKTKLTIITNSLSAANVLIKSKNHVILTGGKLNPETMATDGLQTMDFLSRIKVDVAFLGSSGFEQHDGPSGTDFSDIETKRTILKNAKTGIVVADSQKASYSALMQYASWRDIDHFVTDANLPDGFKKKLNEVTNVIFA